MLQVHEDLQRLLARCACDLRPLMSTTKPTPQASCSCAGSYKPAAGGGASRFWGKPGSGPSAKGARSRVAMAGERPRGKSRGDLFMPQTKSEVKCNINILPCVNEMRGDEMAIARRFCRLVRPKIGHGLDAHGNRCRSATGTTRAPPSTCGRRSSARSGSRWRRRSTTGGTSRWPSTARGLTTLPMPCNGCMMEIAFDFIDHQLIIDLSDGRRRTLALGAAVGGRLLSAS